ncbi:MAG: hypothetical protein MUC59_12450, partial [Saprospiraceae bacterium]|nr:hypothetical protein [Saprospiraceae bacterium]
LEEAVQSGGGFVFFAATKAERQQGERQQQRVKKLDSWHDGDDFFKMIIKIMGKDMGFNLFL